MGQNIGISLDQSLNTLKENITNHPQDAAKGTGELINQLIPQVHDNNLDGMTGVTSQPAHDKGVFLWVDEVNNEFLKSLIKVAWEPSIEYDEKEHRFRI
jgi:hypothetical protein